MFQAIEFIAVVTSACFGILQARAARMDALGVITVAMVIAFGGGTLRDLFLDRTPLFWIANPHYPMIVFAMAVGSCFVRQSIMASRRYLDVPDAFGMGLFSIVGVQFALQAGTTAFIGALMGVMTGTFGGVIGDILCGRVPSLFKASPLYATASFVGCWVFIALLYLELAASFAATAGIVAIVAVRLAAIRWNICLPEMNESPPNP